MTRARSTAATSRQKQSATGAAPAVARRSPAATPSVNHHDVVTTPNPEVLLREVARMAPRRVIASAVEHTWPQLSTLPGAVHRQIVDDLCDALATGEDLSAALERTARVAAPFVRTGDVVVLDR